MGCNRKTNRKSYVIWKEEMKIDTNNLSVMKGFISSYGWVKHKTA